MRRIGLCMLTVVGALALTFVFGSISTAEDSGKSYYPAVTPDISPQCDTKSEGVKPDAPLSSYYPAVTPDISPKSDKTAGVTIDDYSKRSYSPAISPFGN
jgi:hypothetical protein